eukprot:3616085-Pleurochrysis_carterae.AAC.1
MGFFSCQHGNHETLSVRKRLSAPKALCAARACSDVNADDCAWPRVLKLGGDAHEALGELRGRERGARREGERAV